MNYRVAVASSDGKYINQHFGHARQFLIFELEPGADFRFLELRETNPPCDGGEHHDDKLNRAVRAVTDCQFLLVSHIGPGAAQLAKSKGVIPFAYPDFIDIALDKLQKHLEQKK